MNIFNYVNDIQLKLKVVDKTNHSDHDGSYMYNNHGSTALHTFLCIFFTIQCSLYCCVGNRRSALQQYVFEYFIIVIPLILAHTILSDFIILLNVTAFTILILKYMKKYSHIHIVQPFTKRNSFEGQRIHSVTIIRALTYLITVFCILAVDFLCFPRHLAKTETFGYSLMDTGVGLFVLMSGVVHKDLKKDNLSTIIKGNGKIILILVCLGVARFWSVKKLNYPEHVTEYGVHWNFFFTLAVCKLLSTVVLFCTSRALLSSLLVLFIHEFSLWFGLQAWVFSDEPRTTLISANREGLSSSLGYVALYLFATRFKVEINNRNVTRFYVLCKLFIVSILLSVASIIVNFYRPTSRTLANAGYCLYLEALFLSISSFMYFVEVLFQDAESKLHFDVPLILSAINRNGLLYFLMGNVMTGIINMSVRTLWVPSSAAIAIIALYMALSLYLTIVLLKKGIKL